MDAKITHSLKKSALAFCSLLFCVAAMAQNPVVKAIVKNTGSMGEIVSIKGSGFGTDTSKLSVFFGAAKGTNVSAADQLIEVKVPAGATFDNVSVNYSPSTSPGNPGATGYSREQFLLSFNGNPGIDVNNLQGQTDFAAQNGLYDLCMCDFDGDKRVDIATANLSANVVSVYANTSSVGAVSFNKTDLAVGKNTLHIKCRDLNGDGKPDLIATQGSTSATIVSDEIYVFQNKSTGKGNFAFSATPIIVKLTGVVLVKVEVADLDKDGLPEVIFSDQGANGNRIGVLTNQSTASTIQISAIPINFIIDAKAESTDGFSVEDLNGDDLPEIVTGQFLGKDDIFILKNKSIPGTINFGDISKLTIGSTVKRIRIGDLDGDGKPDIAATQLVGLGTGSISFFLNQSTGSTISFGSIKTILTEKNPWGLDFGDLDGDGKIDIAVTSITSASLTILNNTSIPGTLSFTKLVKPTNAFTRHIQIGDVDGDGKPDIAFASIGTPPKLSVFLNKACMIPKLTPEGPLTICSGNPLQLQSTISKGVTYVWKNLTTNTTVSTTNPFFDVTVTGKYTVTAQVGSCSEVSNTVDVTVGGGSALGTAAIPDILPICTDGTLQLTVNDVGATQYKWTGPNGYAGTGLSPTPVTNFSTQNTGRYFLDVYDGTCVAQRTSTTVGIIDIGDFRVTASSPIICAGDPPRTLTVSPTPLGFTYQWYEKTTGMLPGQTGTTFSASSNGEYYVQPSSPSCNNVDPTLPLKITVASIPVVAFTAPASGCKGQNIQFTNQSTTATGLTAVYNWDFGDAKTSTEESPKHNYSSSASLTVKLTVSYSGGACSVSSSKPITIQSAPVVAVTNPDGKYSFCVGEELKLEVLGPSFTSYTWSTGETTPSILVTQAGVYTVEVKTSSCTLNAEQTVETFEPSVVIISADPIQINEGQSSQLTASGLENYTWSPSETLSNASIANPIASPVATVTYTVIGQDINGCTSQATFELLVKGEIIVNKLLPSNFFSPNKSGPVESELWSVDKILDYPQCNVTIYDEKGIKVFEAKPYNNDWDGTFHGKNLPDGVYYYVIRCDGEESKPRSGSITLLR